MRTQADRATMSSDAEASRGCDHPDCGAAGLHRAPKARSRLTDYYWFCLDHVRAYNAAWNYCAGFTEAEIEAQIRSATCWERPTWRLGQWHSYRAEAGMAAFSDGFRSEAEGSERDNRSQRRPGRQTPSDKTAPALAVLGLTAVATPAEVKSRYKRLVKRYHPDANGGDKQAEERLKVINQAYTTLRMHARS